MAVHIAIAPPAKLQVLPGAVQNVVYPVQQGCPMAPHVPHEPFMHRPAGRPGLGHITPEAVHRGRLEVPRTQQPPPAQVLFAQQG
jgi:hypothetical protein